MIYLVQLVLACIDVWWTLDAIKEASLYPVVVRFWQPQPPQATPQLFSERSSDDPRVSTVVHVSNIST